MGNKMKEAEALARATESGADTAADPDLIDLYKNISADFNAGSAPADRIAAVAAAEAAVQPRSANLRWARRGAVVAVALAGIVLAAISIRPAPPTNRTIIASALAAIENRDGVLYMESVQRSRANDPKEDWFEYSDKTWFDIAGDRGRTVRYYGGKLQADTIQANDTLYQYAADSNTLHVSGLVEPGPAWMFKEREQLTQSLRALLKTERAAVMGEETVDGQQTIKIEFDPFGAYGIGGRAGEERPANQPVEKTVVYVDKATFLPVRRTTYRRVGEKWRLWAEIEYQLVEQVALIELPDDLFSTKAFPDDAKTEFSGLFNLEMAKDYRELDLFYLGASFAGLSLSEIARDATSAIEPSVERVENWRPPKYVHVSYSDATDDPAGDSGDLPQVTLSHVEADGILATNLQPNQVDIEEKRTTEMTEINDRTVWLVRWTDRKGLRHASASFIVDQTEVRIGAGDGRRKKFAEDPYDLVRKAIGRLVPLN